jgi:hypothetical protein
MQCNGCTDRRGCIRCMGSSLCASSCGNEYLCPESYWVWGERLPPRSQGTPYYAEHAYVKLGLWRTMLR